MLKPGFPETRTRHFSMNLDKRPGESSIRKGFREKFWDDRPKLPKKCHVNFQNFERLKNCEDNSDFDDFWTKSIASTQTFFQKFSRCRNFFRIDEKIAANERRTNERTSERKSLQVALLLQIFS